MSDSEYLDKAIDFIVEREKDDDYICCALSDTPDEASFCAKDCQGVDRQCVLRFLKHYQKGGEE